LVTFLRATQNFVTRSAFHGLRRPLLLFGGPTLVSVCSSRIIRRALPTSSLFGIFISTFCLLAALLRTLVGLVFKLAFQVHKFALNVSPVNDMALDTQREVQTVTIVELYEPKAPGLTGVVVIDQISLVDRSKKTKVFIKSIFLGTLGQPAYENLVNSFIL
jgi:hypothetical protein